MSVNFQKRTETLHVPNHAPEYTKTSECWFLFGAGRTHGHVCAVTSECWFLFGAGRTHGHVCAVNVVWRQGLKSLGKKLLCFFKTYPAQWRTNR